MFSILRGPLAGKAVAIIVNEGPACKDMTPASLAAYRGSSVFVYHQVGVLECDLLQGCAFQECHVQVDFQTTICDACINAAA
jgi:hypothetical protein